MDILTFLLLGRCHFKSSFLCLFWEEFLCR